MESESVKSRERAHFGGEGVYVISFLERDGAAFGRFLIKIISGFWDRQLEFVKPEWVKGRDVLEVCCGNPRCVLYFASMGACFSTGCDISEEVMRRGLSTEWTYARGRRLKNGDAPVFVADGERLPAADSSFDTLFIMQSIHHLDIDKFTAEAARVLKPGGIFFISDPNGGHPLRKLADHAGRITRVMSSDELSLPIAALSEKMQKAGFEIMQTRAVNFFSEVFFLCTVIVEGKSPAAAAILRLLLAPLAILDRLLDATVFRLFPLLAWRNIVVAKNGKGG